MSPGLIVQAGGPKERALNHLGETRKLGYPNLTLFQVGKALHSRRKLSNTFLGYCQIISSSLLTKERATFACPNEVTPYLRSEGVCNYLPFTISEWTIAESDETSNQTLLARHTCMGSAWPQLQATLHPQGIGKNTPMHHQNIKTLFRDHPN